jgi:hypothetical protein
MYAIAAPLCMALRARVVLVERLSRLQVFGVAAEQYGTLRRATHRDWESGRCGGPQANPRVAKCASAISSSLARPKLAQDAESPVFGPRPSRWCTKELAPPRLILSLGVFRVGAARQLSNERRALLLERIRDVLQEDLTLDSRNSSSTSAGPRLAQTDLLWVQAEPAQGQEAPRWGAPWSTRPSSEAGVPPHSTTRALLLLREVVLARARMLRRPSPGRVLRGSRRDVTM